MNNSTLRKSILILSLLMSVYQQGWASHIMGGQLEMNTQATAGSFRIVLKLYYDDLNATAAVPKASYLVGIYRKADNVLMTNFRVDYKTRTPLVYANQACANQRSLKTSEVTYWKDILLDANVYDNARGYYIVSEIWGRNPDIDNIRNPGDAGIAFYLEFPPLKLSGNIFANSSPVFDAPDGEYICRNDAFRFSSRAKDADGDSLVYSMITPYAGNADFFSTEKISPGPNYPLVQWITGFDENKAITGSPPLNVNQKGLLTVTATGAVNQLHVFCVQVKEYRKIGGTWTQIGLIRRDFQLFVIDCPAVAPPSPTITSGGLPVANDLTVCPGQSIKLESNTDPNWAFQWERDDENIIGEDKPALTISQTGVYRLNIALKNSCSKSTVSQTFTIKNGGSAFPLIVTGGKNGGFCKGETVELKGNVSGSAFTYEWNKEGTVLPTITDKLTVSLAGKYQLKTNNLAATCPSVSTVLEVKEWALPDATISATKTSLCTGETSELSATKYTNAVYEWKNTGTVITTATTEKQSTNQSGTYTLLITDDNGCKASSNQIVITQVNAIVLSIDSINSICDKNIAPITLKASPTGGVFSGNGVGNIDKFNPQIAGIGSHKIRYTVSGSANACQNGFVETTAIISEPPKSSLPGSIIVSKGNTAVLDGKSADGTIYEWSANVGITNVALPKISVQPLQTTNYSLKIKNAVGCEATFNIRVITEERLQIPNAFTPNNDSKNDTWELFGINQYPEAEVFIYDRWGNIVYYSKGYAQAFDGTINGKELPVDVYVYSIKLDNQKPMISGSITILK